MNDAKAPTAAPASRTLTYDFARQMEGATEIKCSEFGENTAANK